MSAFSKKNHISKSYFKAHALEIFRKIELGNFSVIITDHGRPTLEIRKFIEKKEGVNPLEALQGSVLKYDQPLDPVGEDDWQASK